MPRLVDTSIRLLSQEPLSAAMPTAELLRLAEILDGAGYSYLEVSGGGAFDAAVRRGIESPWERIRAIKARTTTPLMLAVRGAFLVGSRPLGDDLVRRFIASAAENGIDGFRLHDPLNDADNLRGAAKAVRAAGREFDAGLLYGSSRHDALIETAQRLPEIGAARILLDDPAGLLQPHRAGELIAELRELSGLPVGLYAQGAGRNGLAVALEAARAGVDLIALRRLPGRARDAPHHGRGARTGARRHRPRDGRRRRHHLARRPTSSTSTSATCRSARCCRASPCARRTESSRRGSSPSSTGSCAGSATATGSTTSSTRSSACGSRPARRRWPRRSGRSWPRSRS